MGMEVPSGGMWGAGGVAEQDTIKMFLELDSVMVVQLCNILKPQNCIL